MNRSYQLFNKYPSPHRLKTVHFRLSWVHRSHKSPIPENAHSMILWSPYHGSILDVYKVRLDNLPVVFWNWASPIGIHIRIFSSAFNTTFKSKSFIIKVWNQKCNRFSNNVEINWIFITCQEFYFLEYDSYLVFNLDGPGVSVPKTWLNFRVGTLSCRVQS